MTKISSSFARGRKITRNLPTRTLKTSVVPFSFTTSKPVHSRFVNFSTTFSTAFVSFGLSLFRLFSSLFIPQILYKRSCRYTTLSDFGEINHCLPGPVIFQRRYFEDRLGALHDDERLPFSDFFRECRDILPEFSKTDDFFHKCGLITRLALVYLKVNLLSSANIGFTILFYLIPVSTSMFRVTVLPGSIVTVAGKSLLIYPIPTIAGLTVYMPGASETL